MTCPWWVYRTWSTRGGHIGWRCSTGMRFAVVPGGRPRLGYDAARFQPAPGQVDSYADSAGELGRPSLSEYVDAMTSPVRSVEIPALLIAVAASGDAWQRRCSKGSRGRRAGEGTLSGLGSVMLAMRPKRTRTLMITPRRMRSSRGSTRPT
jgi:hypothetical protein